jgi:hypothetical protein
MTTGRYEETCWKQTKERKERSRRGWRRAGSDQKAEERGKMLGKIVRGRGEHWVI